LIDSWGGHRLPEMTDIRYRFKRCKILYDNDVNSTTTNITAFLTVAQLYFNVQQ